MSIGYVYILESLSNGVHYIGSSENPQRRLAEHNNGKVTATRNKGPWIIRIIQQYSDISIARKVEYKLKRLKSRKIIDRIIVERFIKIEVA
ncbi:MAG: GIY-YIG nuclease family protein [Patescibacteria group bacterium]